MLHNGPHLSASMGVGRNLSGVIFAHTGARRIVWGGFTVYWKARALEQKAPLASCL